MKGFHRSSWGFHLAHLSPVIILVGFWIDYFHGFRGIISLEVDNVTSEATVYKDHTFFPKGKAILPFDVRLDNFESAKHDPDYRLQIWEKNADEILQSNPDGSTSIQKVPKIKASFPLKVKKIRKIGLMSSIAGSTMAQSPAPLYAIAV